MQAEDMIPPTARAGRKRVMPHPAPFPCRTRESGENIQARARLIVIIKE
jgi:hypothetical protein